MSRYLRVFLAIKYRHILVFKVQLNLSVTKALLSLAVAKYTKPCFFIKILYCHPIVAFPASDSLKTDSKALTTSAAVLFFKTHT